MIKRIINTFTAMSLKKQASIYVAKCEYQKAILLYDKILLLKPKNLSTYRHKYNALLVLEKIDEAIICLDKLIDISPSNSEFYYSKASLLSLGIIGRSEEAIEYYDRALEIKKTYIDAILGKGISLACMKKYMEAEDCYDRVIALTKKPLLLYWAYSNKAIVFIKYKKYDDGIELCDEALRISKKLKFEKDFVYIVKSRIYALMKNKDECLKNLRKAISINDVWKKNVLKCEDYSNFKDDELFMEFLE